MAELLQALEKRMNEPLRSYLRRLLAAYPDLGPGVVLWTKDRPTGLAEPPTGREREILTLIAAGLSNQQIAARLVIEVSTVKRHISNLYGKLGVHRRTEAVACARDLGLLDLVDAS
jgi:ATP/maltotriose-dependent transcriptional regulator MalT